MSSTLSIFNRDGTVRIVAGPIAPIVQLNVAQIAIYWIQTNTVEKPDIFTNWELLQHRMSHVSLPVSHFSFVECTGLHFIVSSPRFASETFLCIMNHFENRSTERTVCAVSLPTKWRRNGYPIRCHNDQYHRQCHIQCRQNSCHNNGEYQWMAQWESQHHRLCR